MDDYFDIYDDDSILEDDDIIEKNSRLIEEQRKRELFDEQFKTFFNPDTSRNTWYDKEYTERYANNPRIQKFLEEKGDLLLRRGNYIAQQAEQGNLEPFVKHSNWLKKQNVLPSDARPAKEFLDTFLNRYNFESESTPIIFHDLYSHAIPEEYLGIVDKSLPNNVSAADESRADLIETLAGVGSIDSEQYFDKTDAVLSNIRKTLKKNPSASFSLASFEGNKSLEYEALLEMYLDKAKKAGWTNTYGTQLEAIDPRVSDPNTLMNDKYLETPWENKEPSTIKKDLLRGIDKRFPSLKAKDIKTFFEKAGAPYIRDLAVSNKLTLAPNAYTNMVSPYTSKNPARFREEANTFLNNAVFSIDPTTSSILGASELGRAIKRTPSALLPGAADLIPSPEAIQTGYARGPVAMGRQMGQEFIQSLPMAAGAAGFLSTPLAAPFAPGIGAGLVGTAGARALNEVVRQETGEGIVPKFRQFIGTAPRTGATAQPQTGEKPLTATLRPLTSAQRSEITRQNNRNELQKRIDLAKERFNPRRGEFGLSELLFGR